VRLAGKGHHLRVGALHDDPVDVHPHPLGQLVIELDHPGGGRQHPARGPLVLSDHHGPGTLDARVEDVVQRQGGRQRGLARPGGQHPAGDLRARVVQQRADQFHLPRPQPQRRLRARTLGHRDKLPAPNVKPFSALRTRPERQWGRLGRSLRARFHG
jgi:hypothetical protein